MESNTLTGWTLPSESVPGIHFAAWMTHKPPRKQHEAPQTTSTIGQMAEALCACRLWAREPSRECSYSEILPALRLPILKTGAKESLQAVQREMCSAQR